MDDGETEAKPASDTLPPQEGDTREALASARRRGVKLGGTEEIFRLSPTRELLQARKFDRERLTIADILGQKSVSMARYYSENAALPARWCAT
jgi:hypothetical protein